MQKTVSLGFVAAGLIFAQDQGRDRRLDTNPLGSEAPNLGESLPHRTVSEVRSNAEYILGPGDQLTIRIADSGESGDRPVVVDTSGYISVPLAGRIKVWGLTAVQVESALATKLKIYFLHPEVLVSVTEYRSQPVSVLGAVRNPGVYQVQGRKTLVEVLSLAGGLDSAAGSTVKITRRRESGAIPLASAAPDSSGQYSVAQLALAGILEAQNPQANIPIQPYDVITVPQAEMVYAVGQVHRAGGFTLHEKEELTVLQVLSLAGGLESDAAPQRARIIRVDAGTLRRNEVAVDLKRILDGRASDVSMQPQDILFVPGSTPKKAGLRAAEAALQMATGVVIWRR